MAQACIFVISALFLLPAQACQSKKGNVDTPSLRLNTDGIRLIDIRGQEVVPRGINVGGGSKLPSRPAARTDQPDFRRTRDISFVDRPFPAAEAATHFTRIANWGFDFIRLSVSWEAIAHRAPGHVDQAYLDHVRALALAAQDARLRVLIDFHQDVWSRWSGGDGAPHWTFAAAGLDIHKFAKTGAAILHDVEGDDFEPLLWPTNHSKLAAATMFTLFFAGDAFAPELVTGGTSIQTFLQDEYIHAVVSLTKHLADVDAVIGYDLMNEPAAGFIGLPSLGAWETELKLGPMPTPAQAMFAGQFSQDVTVWTFSGFGFSPDGHRLLNPDETSVWLDTHSDIWQQAGVWGVVDNMPAILVDDYFAYRDGKSVDFVRDFLLPFYAKLATAISVIDPHALIFIETSAETNNAPNWSETLPPAVFAPHWYDALALVTRSFDPEFNIRREPELDIVLGRNNVQALFNEQVSAIVARGHDAGLPVFIGEYGLPFESDPDTDALRVEAIHMYDNALSAGSVGGALWHYNPDNSRAYGDGWNLEDFSVIGNDDPNGRALETIAR